LKDLRLKDLRLKDMRLKDLRRPPAPGASYPATRCL
jgi:hypothetical protein